MTTNNIKIKHQENKIKYLQTDVYTHIFWT